MRETMGPVNAMQPTYPIYLAGLPAVPNLDLPVTDKFTGEIIAHVPEASHNDISMSIEAAVDSQEELRRLPPFHRQEILYSCIDKFKERAEELALILCREAGKPIRDSRAEVGRLIDTFRIAAEESVRIPGEMLNLEISPRARGYRGMVQRVPIGPCSFISPFNFPLNLVAHKIAPAIAVGCPWILKPASKTPVSALVIGEILSQTGLPRGSFSILPCGRGGADLFSTDPRIKFLSFTGSPDVGWKLKSQAGKKRVTLELGGNAACIVDADADQDDAVARLVFGAFYQSGQSCIGVQRILIHDSIYESMKSRLVAATSKLKMGDPKDESVFLGPLIDVSEAIRLEKWVRAAVAAGGKILCGGTRQGPFLAATLLENVPVNETICAEEAFGPVAVLSMFRDFDDALEQVNHSRFGLQAGVFTRDLYRMQRAWDRLEVGGVIIGDVPSWRADNMPYGGVHDSGLGREGVRYAMEDMTEPRALIIRTPQ
jgi:acyl-CoA reductase-like NAD-dependent aldehyde dehydrogenase